MLRAGPSIVQRSDGSVINFADAFDANGRLIGTGGGSGGELYILDQKTHADLVGDVITFALPVSSPVEIYNADPDNDGVFTINGFGVHVLKGSPPFVVRVRGTLSNIVRVSGSTSFVLTIYEEETV